MIIVALLILFETDSLYITLKINKKFSQLKPFVMSFSYKNGTKVTKLTIDHIPKELLSYACIVFDISCVILGRM